MEPIFRIRREAFRPSRRAGGVRNSRVYFSVD